MYSTSFGTKTLVGRIAMRKNISGGNLSSIKPSTMPLYPKEDTDDTPEMVHGSGFVHSIYLIYGSHHGSKIFPSPRHIRTQS